MSRVLRPPRGTTALELDPLAAISARGFLVVVAAVSLLCAVALTVTARDQVSSWPMAVAALVALAGGHAWFLRSAFRGASGVTSDRFALAFALIALATILNSLSCLGTNTVIRDDWGLVTIGLALMAAAPFRTSSELGTYTAISVALAVLLAVVHIILSFGDGLPALVIIAVAAAPSLALGLGAAAYARELLAGIYAERLAQAEARNLKFDELRRAFVDDDVVGEIGALRAEVVPFLARVRQAGAVSAHDRAFAAMLAHGLEAALADSRRLDSLDDHVGRLIDESGLSRRLHEDDRATIRALLIGLEESEYTTPGSIVLEFIEGESDRFGMVRCASDDVRALRSEVMPFLRMVRLMFRTGSDQVNGSELLIQFDIERLA